MRMSSKQKFGLKGELRVKAELENRGYDVRLISNWVDTYDLVINSCLPVEVKTARLHHRTIRPGYTRPVYVFETARMPRNSDFLVVLGVFDQQRRYWPYLAPSWLVTQRTMITITSHPLQYGGMWAKYLYNWSMIDRLIGIRQRLGQSLQLSFWDRNLDPNIRTSSVSQKAVQV